MKKINLKLTPKHHNFMILGFFAFLTIFSIIWGVIFADSNTFSAPPTIPVPPSNLSSSNISTNSITLNWIDNSSNEDKWNIDRKLTTDTNWSSLVTTQINSSDLTTYTDTSVSPQTSYDYRIQACLSGTGCSEYTYLIGVQTLALTTNLFQNQNTYNSTTNSNQSLSTNSYTNTTTSTIPAAPTNLVATVSGNNVTLSWTDNSSNEAGFKIYRGPIWTDIGNVKENVTTFVDSNRPAGTYTYHLNAFSSTYSYSPISNDVSVTIPASTTSTSTTTNTTDTTTQKGSSTDSKTATISNYSPEKSKVANNAKTIDTSTDIVTTPTTSIVTPTIAPQTTTSKLVKTEVITKIENIGQTVAENKIALDNSKEQLQRVINDSIDKIVKNAPEKINTEKINNLKEELLKNVDTTLSNPEVATSTDMNGLKNDINNGLKEIGSVTGAASLENTLSQVTNTFESVSSTVQKQSEILKDTGADLLYKDSNNDGISDYDSIYVYNIDPVKPSPVSVYEGKPIKAADKILLGLDPTKSEIVKVEKEEPVKSPAATVSTYKVEQVAMTENKQLIIKGQALPNSFITVYIYSTPIMVTVKTDSHGEWQYILDKELENGDHTVYTATVNNSGNIVAKSSGFLFTKTAEAVSLKDLPPPSSDTKPSLFGNNNLYMILGIIMIATIGTFVGIGLNLKKKE